VRVPVGEVLSRRVLIVEDEFLVADDVRAALEDVGHEVVGIAADVPEALEMARLGRPDVALVDLNLRDGPTGGPLGLLLAREHGVLVLFVTSEPNLAPTGAAGVLGVFSKPFACEQLAEVVGRADGYRRTALSSSP
jgi:DNA-binding NarL/FixJ family response regulator